jgi:hypothetical protein
MQLAIVLITAVLLCLPASTALATNATEIKVGGFTLKPPTPTGETEAARERKRLEHLL